MFVMEEEARRGGLGARLQLPCWLGVLLYAMCVWMGIGYRIYYIYRLYISKEGDGMVVVVIYRVSV